MDDQIKARWVAELRSGKYQQAANKLRCTSGHCCLGVLGEILAEEGIAEWRGSRLFFRSHGSQVELPEGLDRHLGMFEEAQSVLVGMNDDEHKSFNEIADYIEANL